jgi:hypothetical protein
MIMPKEKGQGETAQWPKEKGQRDKQRSKKNTHTTKQHYLCLSP